PEPPALRILGHVAQPGQRREQPVHGRNGQVEVAGQVAGGPFRVEFGKRLENGEGPLEHLQRRPARLGLFRAARWLASRKTGWRGRVRSPVWYSREAHVLLPFTPLMPLRTGRYHS